MDKGRNSLSVSPKTLPNGLPSQPREASVKKEVSKLSEEDRPGGDSEVKSGKWPSDTLSRLGSNTSCVISGIHAVPVVHTLYSIFLLTTKPWHPYATG